MNIALVIPCYKSKKNIVRVLKRIGTNIKKILIVDDNCPEKTGKFVLSKFKDRRFQFIFNKKNLGVGGAVIEGFKALRKQNIDIIVKLDSDGQMDPKKIDDLIRPLIHLKAEFVKGNRFFSFDNTISMPKIRLFGNLVLTLLTKISSGYYSIKDPTNGFFAIKKKTLFKINFQKLSKDYFFETSMLFNLYLIKAKIFHLNTKSIYFKNSQSSLNILKIIPIFLKEHFLFFFKRVLTNKHHKICILSQIIIFFFLKLIKLNIFIYLIPSFIILFFIIDTANEPN